ncbi:unnamed protein product [Parascedosporium putredinis]|uniref:Choline/carnitine acyltransferase domain-containing protein n=1 Tax=Parascedosporium putredinis TaxID=1442378 RepID=A0A9P1MES2_9PEZI|nr:unnamed protein product [Parascedosporium putredinis]CAI8005114.1 unnamed protein product [Parascedosporium putredinis]
MAPTARRSNSSIPSELATSKAAVDDFIKPGGVGQRLQENSSRGEKTRSTRTGYTSVPYVSYFYSHRDDRNRRNPAKRAAAITTSVLEFKKQVDQGTLEPEYMKKMPICMDSYQWMFNTSRVAARPADYPIKFAPGENKHIICCSPIGALTSENRDVWADARQLLVDAHPSNAAALEAIESSSFVVCLDDAAPVTLEERAHQYWHGDGANRWYDKPLQFIVNDNGTSGFMGEHSMMDGTPTHRLNDYINDLIFNNKMDFSDPSIRSTLPEPEVVKFHVTNEVQDEIDRAVKDFRTVIGQHQLAVQAYQGYGKGLIKKFKCSPDAYVQMIIQLAYNKMYGKNRPTYESAATRRFQQGRTETCRSVSEASVSWCKAMSEPAVSNDEKVRLFRAAVDSHLEYIAAASDGKGVDRHLFGLKKLLEPGEDLLRFSRIPHSVSRVLGTCRPPSLVRNSSMAMAGAK